MSEEKAGIQELRDELAIRDLVARYSEAVDRRDEKASAETWAEDGIWNVGPSHATGREAVVKTWSGLMELFRFVTQMPQSGFIELDGNHARGTWQVMELGGPHQGDPSCTLGVYDDRYRRTDAGWRFAERSFHFVYMGPPDLSGRLIGHPSSPLPAEEG